MKKRDLLKLKQEVCDAYADCNLQSYGEGMRLRKLDYRASESCGGSEMIAIMKDAVIGGYNQFDENETPREVVEVFGEDADYTIAREGSVCLYVRPSKDGDYSFDAADEFDFDERTGEYRLWWD